MILLNYQLYSKLTNKEKLDYINKLNQEFKYSEEVLTEDFAYQKFLLNYESQESKNDFNIIIGFFGVIFTLYQLKLNFYFIFFLIFLLIIFIIYITIGRINNRDEIKKQKETLQKIHIRYQYKAKLVNYIENIFQIEELLKNKKISNDESKRLKNSLNENISKYDFLLIDKINEIYNEK